MKEITSLRNFTNKNEDKSRKRWVLALYFCSLGGFFTGVMGLLVSASAFFVRIENAETINRTGTWLMAAAFPLVIIGAHAMDKIAEIDKNKELKAYKTEQKREYYLPEQWRDESVAQL